MPIVATVAGTALSDTAWVGGYPLGFAGLPFADLCLDMPRA
jgi:hypothetical protein